MNITESELLQAIQDAMQATPDNPSGALTREDLQDQLELSTYSVRKFLKQLHKAGKLEVVKVYRETIDGVKRPTPAYRIRSET